jgi:hypothetical protein
VSGDVPTAGEGNPEREFSIVRKGYDPDEVEEVLAEYDATVRDIEQYAGRLKHELAEARVEIKRLQDGEQEAVDRAMRAIIDSKDRILERARQKAREIENEARLAAGLPPVDEAQPGADPTKVDPEVSVDPPPEAPVPAAPAVEQPVEVPAVAPSEASQEEPQPAEILRQMLQEADTIRNQLEQGLSSAFDEIQRMQQDAEARAAALLDEARDEAERLRAAGEAGSGAIQVTLEAEDGPTESEQGSRYSRNSAKLPRIGEPAGESVLASMNQLRNKLREAEEAARKVKDPAS